MEEDGWQNEEFYETIRELKAEVDRLQDKVANREMLRGMQDAEIERLWAEAKQWKDTAEYWAEGFSRWFDEAERMRAELAKKQEPEGEREEQVAEWLRGRGYVVTRAGQEPFKPGDACEMTITCKDAQYCVMDCRAVQSLKAGELPDDVVAAIKETKMDERHNHLNALIDDPKDVQSASKWPARCIKPNSCARNMGCMYLKCPHEQDAALQDDIRAALSANPKSPPRCSRCGESHSPRCE